MAVDEQLADRIRGLVLAEPELSERRMFGGVAFLLGGHLAVAATSRGDLMLRCDPADGETLLTEPGVSRFEMRGRGMRGWLRVDPEVCVEDSALRRWVSIGLDYARALPAKE